MSKEVAFKEGSFQNLPKKNIQSGTLYLAKNGDEAYLFYGENKNTLISILGRDSVKRTGDTMTGLLNAQKGISLTNEGTPENNKIQYILGIESFNGSENGKVCHIDVNNLKVKSAAGADVASKLSVNAGTVTEPVYFSKGIPVKCNGVVITPGDQEFTGTKTFIGETVMKNDTYCNNMIDIGQSIGCSLKNTRALNNQLMVGEILLPNKQSDSTDVNDTNNDANEIRIYKLTGYNAGRITSKTLIGKFTENGWEGRANHATSADRATSATSADMATEASYLSSSTTFVLENPEDAITPNDVHTIIGNGSRIKRGTWSYASNSWIEKGNIALTQCPYGALDLAGTTVIQSSNSSSQYTQIYITPPTSSGTPDAIRGEMIYFINNGSNYSPTWYRVLTDKNYTNYTVTKTGTGASGTWGIDISGTARNATSADTAEIARKDSDGNLITDTYLKKSGGTVTGNLNIFKETTTADNNCAKITFGVKNTTTGITTENKSFIAAYDDHDSATNGLNMVIKACGNLILGGGESAGNFYTNVINAESSTLKTTEHTYITADSNIYFYAKCNDIENRVGIILNSDSKFYPETSDSWKLGTSAHKWNEVHATTFYGNLNGTATRATSAAGADIATTISTTLNIDKGGTGGTTRNAAVANLHYLGYNPINLLSNDTSEKWGAFGTNATSFIKTSGCLNNQPATYGLIFQWSAGANSSEIAQLWHTQPGGSLYHRGGNGSGWGCNWTEVLDATNYTNYTVTKTGTGASGTWGIDISGTARNATSADVANKLGVNAGTTTKPVYFSNGIPVECSTYAGGTKVTLNGTNKGASTASFYAPTGAGTSGYILKSNGSGAAPSWAAITNNDATLAWDTTSTIATIAGTDIKVTMPANPNTNTHHKAYLYATSSSGTSNAATTNGNTYLRLIENNNARSSIKIAGSGAANVTSDASGNITISSTNTNYYHTRTYSGGLKISTGTGVSDMYVPNATNSQAGVVTTENQTFSGTKTFTTIVSKNVILKDGTNSSQYGQLIVKTVGTTSTQGVAQLWLGNTQAEKTAGGAQGQLVLYSAGTKFGVLNPPSATLSENINFYMPNTGGTLVTHATRGTAVGSSLNPVYIESTGRATACAVCSSGNYFGIVPYIGTDGVMEIGKYIDFHNSDTSTNDYDTRLMSSGTTANVVTLPTISGEIVTHTADTAQGSDLLPVYVNADGAITACNGNIITTEAQSFSGTKTFTRVRISATTDADVGSAKNVALIVGNPTGTHLEFDSNEIMVKASGTTGGNLTLNSGCGYVKIGGGGFVISSSIYGDSSGFPANPVDGQIYFQYA